MSLLPSYVQNTITSLQADQTRNAVMRREYGVDFDSGQLTGQMVTGREAVKVWVWKCLMTERFRYPVYAWIYGSELDSYIGKAITQEFINTDIRLALTDALLINPDIVDVKDFSGSIDKDILRISFTVETIYGDVDIIDYEIREHITSGQYLANMARDAIQGGSVMFWVEDDRLMLRTYPRVEEAVVFSLNAYGHLIAEESEEFSDTVDMRINNGLLEAEYDV